MDDRIDQAAQEQEDHQSMVESTVDRKILLDMMVGKKHAQQTQDRFNLCEPQKGLAKN